MARQVGCDERSVAVVRAGFARLTYARDRAALRLACYSTPPPPPPPPRKSGRGAEPVGALGRTARCLKAVLAAALLLTFVAALAPQDARAQEKPALTATAGVGSVTLNWTRTGNTGFGYWVYRQGVTGGGYGDWIDIPGGATIRTHTVTGLTAGTSYTFQVARAEGTGLNFSVFASGGGYSNGASATPTAATTTTVPAAPTNLTATGAGTTQVLLTWTKPAGTITGYKLRYAKTPAKGSATWAAMAGSGANTVRHMVTGLEDDAEYSFMIRAVNASGDGAATGWVTATPMDSCPSVLSPTNLSLAPRSDGFVVTWTAPTDVFRNGWTLSYGKTGESSTSVTISNAAATSRTLTGLDTNTEYEISLTATHSTYNPSAVCPPGFRVKATGTTAAAGPTVTLTAAPGDGQVTLSWTYTNDDGEAFDHWRYAQKKGGGSYSGLGDEIPGGKAIRTHTVTGLENGAAYTFKVSRGVSSPPPLRIQTTALPYSNEVTATPAGSPAVPAKPTGLSAEAGNAQVKLTWTDPDDDSITRYQLRQKKGSAAWGGWAAISGSDADTTSHTVTGLDNDVAYRFRIRARNSGGNSAPSAVVEATPAASAAVPKPVLSAEAGYARVTLSWSALSGVTVASWGYEYKSAGGSWSSTTTVSDGSATSVTVTGLTIGTEYTFRLFAAVSLGVQSVWSDEVKATPTNTVPKPVLTAAAGDRSVTLSWSALSGIPITSWGYQYKSSGGWSTTTAVTGGSTTSATVTGLTGGTEYTFRLFAAVSPGVQSVWSDEVKATPYALAAPVLTSITSGATGFNQGVIAITLTWTHSGQLLPSGVGWWYWQIDYRLKGASSWVAGDRTGGASQLSRRTIKWGTGFRFPEGAVLEVRIRGRGGERPDQAGLWSNIRTVTLVDDTKDIPALTITGSPVTVTAGSTAATYTVALTKALAGTLSITSGDTGKATVSPPSLTFTAGNYNTAQTVTVTGVAEGTATINHAFRLTGAMADAIPDAGTVTVTVNGAPAKPAGFTAVQGSGNEQAMLSWSDPNDASITKWQYSQDGVWKDVPGSSASTTTYTVTGLSTGTAYAFKVRAVNVNGAGAASDEATVTPAWTGVPAKPSGLRAEAGVEQVTLSWDAQPNQRISRWGHQRRASGGAWPASATFVAGTGATATRTVTGLTAGTAYEFRIQASQGSGNDGPWSDVVTATPFAAGTPRVVVTPTALTIEEGRSGTYTVKLNTAPSANVTVTVGGESGEVTVTGSPLTFTPGNYDTAQTVTVNAGTDDDSTDDTATLTHTSASSDSNYGSSLNIDEVAVTVTDTTPPSSDPADDGDGDDGESGDVEVVEKVVEVVDGDGVFFQDAGLAGVVARALGATDLARRNEPEVALLRVLNAARSGVADLAGLEIASGLKSLDLGGNRITDLTPLAALDGLTTLILSGNPNLENLAPLAGLTLLGHLDLSSNRRITDLTPLSGLALLETLRLDRTGVSDLTPLAGLVRLKTLNLSWNRQIVDLSPLSGLILLETLRLDGIGASDLAPLAGLTRLETLTLSSNRQIVDLSALSGLTMLRTLRLDHTGATDFSLLSAFTELRTLSLSGNGITDLSPLQALVKLSALHLGANRIEEVSLLAGLTELRSLSLNDNRITDVTALAALPRLASLNLNGNPLSGFPSTGFRQLRGLYLRDCGVADIGALAHLAQIETLFLDGNGIGDLTPLSSLSGLTKLFLARNAISDLTPLSQLAALRQLVLDDNDISDVSALSSLSGLTKLFLTRNEVSDLTPLSRLAELEQLTLGGNDVADVSALSGLRKLELLSLGQNQVADIAALAKLPALEYLDLRDNPLDPDALNIHIPALEERGVQVLY